MTGTGKHTTYKNGDDWGMVYNCFIHIKFEGMTTGEYTELLSIMYQC